MAETKAPAAEAAETKAPAAEAAAEPVLQPGNVWCRITKVGHNKIFTGDVGVYVAGEAYEGSVAFPRHAWNDVIQLPRKIAQAQEDNGNLEIQD